MDKINIIVVGASGKMGQAIIKETLDDSDFKSYDGNRYKNLTKNW
jgi:dihydrodipicolinate reductase